MIRYAGILLLAASMMAPCLTVQADTPGQTPAVQAPASVSHAAWSDLLETYLRAGPDSVNRVDYAGLKADPDARKRLSNYISGFASVEFDALSRDAAFAAWTNLYNAAMVDHVLDKYPTSTIKPWYSRGPWRAIKVVADGREVSLHRIEHEILRARWDEPRVHYALNCASIGCPDLKPTAWTPETLDKDLDKAARAHINHARGVRVSSRGGLTVSSIYKWFREDFDGDEAGVIDHLKTHAAPELRARIEADPRIRTYQYDWSLNDAER